jgi:hypothetical protein
MVASAKSKLENVPLISKWLYLSKNDWCLYLTIVLWLYDYRVQVKSDKMIIAYLTIVQIESRKCQIYVSKMKLSFPYFDLPC